MAVRDSYSAGHEIPGPFPGLAAVLNIRDL